MLKVIERVRVDNQREKVASQQQSRQAKLKGRYNKLRTSLATEELRNSVPLFSDFLHLPSVKTMWESDKSSQDDATWQENLEAVMEELDEYRVDVRLETIRTILRATTTMSEEEVDNNDSDELISDQYGDAFFKLATSMLVCNLPKCAHKKRHSYGQPYWGYYQEKIPHFIGPLDKLLEHHHDRHADYTPSATKRKAQDSVDPHCNVPVEVALVTSACLDLLKLDEKTTSFDQLEQTASSAGHFLWENAPSGKKWGWGPRRLVGRDRNKLFAAAHSCSSLQLDRVVKVKVNSPKVALPVPTVVFYPSRKYLTSEKSSKSGPKRQVPDFDEDDSDSDDEQDDDEVAIEQDEQ